MLRSAWAIVRQPRYAALSVLMLFVALGCIAAGTWQIVRFEDKVAANDALRGNAHAAPAPVAQVLPLTTGTAPGKDAVQLRTVTATGRYDATHQILAANRSVGGRDGYLVLTPLITDSRSSATLLVVRGFVQQHADGTPPPVPAPPTGPVTVKARVVVGESGNEGYTSASSGATVSHIVPSAQAKRLGTPVFAGYAELLADQPGGDGLTTIPGPSLSNPAGGAVEPQHFAYIIQWYLFAALALAAPFAMAWADRRENAAAGVRELPKTADELRAARLADRYGRAVR